MSLSYLLTALRLLGMYAEQGGIPAIAVPVALLLAIGAGLGIDAWVGFLMLCAILTGLPALAQWRTQRTAKAHVAPVRLVRSAAVTTLFFPGLGNAETQLWRYAGGPFPGSMDLLINPVYVESYDAHNLFKTNIGGWGDVVHAMAQVNRIMAERPEDSFIFFGTSRGAAVALTVLHNLGLAQIHRVKFAVLEGVFTSVPDVMRYRFGPRWAPTLERLLLGVTEYKADQTSPLDIAARFAHPQLPLLLVSSIQDTLVPLAQTQEVHRALCARGMKILTLKVLEHSPHSSYATWDDRDRQVYAAVIQEAINKHV
jgi:hypothetical protein